MADALMAPTEFYPWHTSQRDRLVGLHRKDKLPHALLLSGPRHLGKREFARAMAGFVLCEAPTSLGSCGDCSGCHLVRAGTHPDLRLVTFLDDTKKLIVIDQIRDLIDWSSQTSQRNGYKVVIVHPAEQMNVHSANALLKCLEEPGRSTLIMLITDLPGRLLPTIRSRCQRVGFTIPPAAESLDFLRANAAGDRDIELLLAIGGGAPLAVGDFDDDYLARRKIIAQSITSLMTGTNPLAVARVFGKGDPGADLAVVYSLFADALRVKLTLNLNLIKNKDMGDVLNAICKVINTRNLFRTLDAISRDRRDLGGPSNPNVTLLFENLMIEVASYCAL